MRRILLLIERILRLWRRTRHVSAVKVICLLVLIQLIYYSSYSYQVPMVKRVNPLNVAKVIKLYDVSNIRGKAVSDLDDEKKVLANEIKNTNTTSDTLLLYMKENLDILLSSTVLLGDKCDLFFYYLHSIENPHWDIHADDLYDPEAFDKDTYIDTRRQEKLDEMKKAFLDKARKDIVDQNKKKGIKLDESEIQKLLPKFEGKVTAELLLEFEKSHSMANMQNLEIEMDKVNRASNLRIFGKCFFHDSYKKDDGRKPRQIASLSSELCPYTERKLFPFLSSQYPVYKRWTGQTYHAVPIISNVMENDNREHKLLETVDTSSFSNPNCFISSFYSSINGKGIVLSVSDSYAQEVVKLLKVLRITGNEFPIQLVHSGDLSDKNQRLLLKYARDKSLEEIMNNDPDFSQYNYKDYINHGFPSQELWFVNVKNAIEQDYVEYFESYSSKLLAYFFNSFDEIMLMDTDTIPLIPTRELFRLDKYQEHGALFFKDRDLDDLLWTYDANLWKKVMPKYIDEKFFGIPQSTNFTLKNRYLGDERRHYMEAGLVLMKRSTHFTGVLMSLEINLWGVVSADKVWGDKEFFWLGQSLAGNENYHFNINQAGAAGQVHRVEGKISNEVCSAHPGHIWDKDNRTLLWINSGFQNCKKGTWNVDVYNERFKRTRKHNKKVLKKHYEDFTRINAVIVPPITNYMLKNSADEPAFGWYKTNLCAGYMWCAYDILGASENPNDRGLLIEYDSDTQKFYEIIGQIWNGKT